MTNFNIATAMLICLRFTVCTFGTEQVAENDVSKAVGQQLKKAFKIVFDPGTTTNLSFKEEREEKWKAIKIHIDMAHKLSPNDARIEYAYGALLEKLHFSSEAKEAFIRSFQTDSKPYWPSWRAVIWFQFINGKASNAYSSLDQFAERLLVSDSPNIVVQSEIEWIGTVMQAEFLINESRQLNERRHIEEKAKKETNKSKTKSTSFPAKSIYLVAQEEWESADKRLNDLFDSQHASAYELGKAKVEQIDADRFNRLAMKREENVSKAQKKDEKQNEEIQSALGKNDMRIESLTNEAQNLLKLYQSANAKMSRDMSILEDEYERCLKDKSRAAHDYDALMVQFADLEKQSQNSSNQVKKKTNNALDPKLTPNEPPNVVKPNINTGGRSLVIGPVDTVFVPGTGVGNFDYMKVQNDLVDVTKRIEILDQKITDVQLRASQRYEQFEVETRSCRKSQEISRFIDRDVIQRDVLVRRKMKSVSKPSAKQEKDKFDRINGNKTFIEYVKYEPEKSYNQMLASYGVVVGHGSKENSDLKNTPKK